MVVGLDPDSPELSVGNLVGLLGNDLPAVVVSDGPIPRVHDSLPPVAAVDGWPAKCGTIPPSSVTDQEGN
jgi:hypothetical protein